MNIKQTLLTTALFPLGLMMSTRTASAHMIQTDYQLRLNSLEIQSTFSGEEAFAGAPVSVYSPENPDQPVFIGRTDENGKFSFRPDPAIEGDWSVEIGNADDSHWDYLVIPVNEHKIDLDAISKQPQPEHHHNYLAYSYLALLAGIGTLCGYRWWQQSEQS
jgi:nickel transport protein